MTLRIGQFRHRLTGGWLVLSVVSLAGPSAVAGEWPSGSVGQAEARAAAPKREAPVFTYPQFTAHLPALTEPQKDAAGADDAPALLPVRSPYPPASQDGAGLMGRFEDGFDAAAARQGLSAVSAREATPPAEEPDTTAAVARPRPGSETAADRTAGQSKTVLLGSGRASWYKHSGKTASGKPFNPEALTAAHHTLPFGTKVKVVNKQNGRAVVVEITDRTNEQTKLKRNYAIDLSRASARRLGIEGIGQVALYKVD
jgi:rare lipoprotein A